MVVGVVGMPLLRMVADRHEWLWMVVDGLGWLRIQTWMVADGHRWVWMDVGGADGCGWLQMVADGCAVIIKSGVRKKKILT